MWALILALGAALGVLGALGVAWYRARGAEDRAVAAESARAAGDARIADLERVRAQGIVNAYAEATAAAKSATPDQATKELNDALDRARK